MAGLLRTVRALALEAACAGAALLGWWLGAGPVGDLAAAATGRGPGPLTATPFATLLVGVAALALLAAVGWLVLATTVATTLELARVLAPGTRADRLLTAVVDRVSPVLVRRVVAAVVGTAVTAGLAAGPALADRSAGSARGLTGLALPERTTGSAGPATRAVVVRPGDCLWSIAADRLPAAASDAAVTAAWHRLHAANRERIGPDPDLIVPGTRLVVPDQTPHREDAP